MSEFPTVTILQLLTVVSGSVLFASLCVPFIVKHARNSGFVDEPNKRVVRRAGKEPTATRTVPTLGGLAVASGTVCGLGLAFSFELLSFASLGHADLDALAVLVLSAVTMLWVGFRDDLGKASSSLHSRRTPAPSSSSPKQTSKTQASGSGRAFSCRRGNFTVREELSGRTKLYFQLGVALMCCFGGLRVENVDLPGVTIQLGLWSWPLTIIWVVGIINSMNLLDGLDGLAGGVAATISLALGVAALSCGAWLVAVMCFALAGSCIGFLRHNFEPARIYLGDTGSLFLGTMLVGLNALTSYAWHGDCSLSWAFALVFALPIADTAQVMVRRKLAGRSVMIGDRRHIHYMLVDRAKLRAGVISPLLHLVVLLSSLPLLYMVWTAYSSTAG